MGSVHTVKPRITDIRLIYTDTCLLGIEHFMEFGHYKCFIIIIISSSSSSSSSSSIIIIIIIIIRDSLL